MESDDYKLFIKRNLGGAAQPQANAQILGSYKIAIPMVELCGQLDKILEPIFDLKESLQIENQNLRRTRDFLLPKLISGEVEV